MEKEAELQTGLQLKKDSEGLETLRLFLSPQLAPETLQ